MGKKACPLCGAALKSKGKLCPGCGVRLGPVAWLLSYFPGLARLKVVLAAAGAFAAGVAQLVALAQCLTGWELLEGLPLVGLSLAGVFLGYCIALCWLMVGSVCWPLRGFAELDRKKRSLFLWMAFLPLAGWFMLLFR
jgi:hypothetical protein